MCRAAQVANIRQMSRQVSRGSASEYQADVQAGVTRFSWPVSVRSAGRCRVAQLASREIRMWAKWVKVVKRSKFPVMK